MVKHWPAALLVATLSSIALCSESYVESQKTHLIERASFRVDGLALFDTLCSSEPFLAAGGWAHITPDCYRQVEDPLSYAEMEQGQNTVFFKYVRGRRLRMGSVRIEAPVSAATLRQELGAPTLFTKRYALTVKYPGTIRPVLNVWVFREKFQELRALFDGGQVCFFELDTEPWPNEDKPKK